MEYTFSGNDLISTSGFGFLHVDSIKINDDGIRISGLKVKCPFPKIGLFLWYSLTAMSIILCLSLALVGLIGGCIIIASVLKVPPSWLDPIYVSSFFVTILFITSYPLFRMYDILLIEGCTVEFDTLQVTGKKEWKAAGQQILSLKVIVDNNRGKLCVPFPDKLQMKLFENDLKASNIVSHSTKTAC